MKTALSVFLLTFLNAAVAADNRSFQPDLTVFMDNGSHYDVWSAAFLSGDSRGARFVYEIPSAVLPIRVGITNYYIPLEQVSQLTFRPRMVERDPRQGTFLGRPGMNQVQACSIAQIRLTSGVTTEGIVNLGGGVSGPCPFQMLPMPGAVLQGSISVLGTAQTRSISLGEVREISIDGDSCRATVANWNQTQQVAMTNCHWGAGQRGSIQAASLMEPVPITFKGARVSLDPKAIAELRLPSTDAQRRYTGWQFVLVNGQIEVGDLADKLTLIGRDSVGGLVYLPLEGRSGFTNDREPRPLRLVFNRSSRAVKLIADAAGTITIDNQVRVAVGKKSPKELWLAEGRHQLDLVPADQRLQKKTMEVALSDIGQDGIQMKVLEGYTPPGKISGPKPTAPPEALESGLRGVVTAKAPIDKTGKISGEITVEPRLHPAIVASVRQTIRLAWKIEPAMRDGEPTDGVLEVQFEFPKDFERPLR